MNRWRVLYQGFSSKDPDIYNQPAESPIEQIYVVVDALTEAAAEASLKRYVPVFENKVGFSGHGPVMQLSDQGLTKILKDCEKNNGTRILRLDNHKNP